MGFSLIVAVQMNPFVVFKEPNFLQVNFNLTGGMAVDLLHDIINLNCIFSINTILSNISNDVIDELPEVYTNW